MFAARNVDGDWFICIRRGRLIRTVQYDNGTQEVLMFGSQAKAKSCADELNEKYLNDYEKYISRQGLVLAQPEDEDFKKLKIDMLEVINNHRR